MDQQEHESIFQYQMSFGSGSVIVLLVLALIALGERILYDIGRTFAQPPLDYFGNLDVIIVHSFFVIPLLIISIIINLLVGSKKAKYAIVLIPYFVLSIVMALQLALQIAVYFRYHHTQLQFYVVMVIMVVVCTYAIYWIQSKFAPKNT